MTFTNTGNYISIGREREELLINSGILFRGIRIPPKSTITEAHMELAADVVDAGGTDPLSLRIYGGGDPPAIAPPGNCDLAEAIAATVAYVSWPVDAVWTDKQWVITPNIKTIVQEMVNKSNWSIGSNMLLFIKEYNSAGYKERAIYSVRYSSGAYASKLIIGFTYSGKRIYI